MKRRRGGHFKYGHRTYTHTYYIKIQERYSLPKFPFTGVIDKDQTYKTNPMGSVVVNTRENCWYYHLRGHFMTLGRRDEF